MASLLSKEPVCQKEDSPLIDIPCIESLSRLSTQKSFGSLNALRFEFPASKETYGKQRKVRKNIAEVKQTRMFSVMAN